MSARTSRVLLLAAFVGAGASAQEAVPEQRVVQGRSAVLTLPSDALRIAVGDRSIVRVTLLDPRQLLLDSLRPGRTNLLVWDATGKVAERFVLVERDLGPLREQLLRIDPSVRVETDSDGSSLLLTGTVAGLAEMNAALDLAGRYLAGDGRSRGKAAGTPVLIEAGKKEDPEAKPEAGEEAEFQKSGPAAPAPGVRNLLVVRDLPAVLERRLEEAIRPLGGDVRIRRLVKDRVPNDDVDSFVLEGTVPSQAALVRMLVILDALTGGGNPNRQGVAMPVVLADDAGGLAAGRGGANASGGSSAGTTASGTGARGGGGGRAIGGGGIGNDLALNVGRGLIVRSGSGRVLSFAKVANLPQVLTAVRVIDFDRSGLIDFGVSWGAALADFTTGAPLGANSTLPDAQNVLSIVNGLTTNRFTFVDRRFQLTQALSFLESKGLVRTLSEPNLVTLSGETASFRVGGTVPQRTVVSTNTAALVNVEQIPFGVELQVRPIVGEDGTLTLDVVPSISSLGPLSPEGDPSFVDTTLKTSVRLKHGEGIVLGGLIQQEERESTDQVPFLGDVPLLGALFGRKIKDRRDREVALVLLPRVVVPKPEGRFALEVPPPDFRARAGVFLDPELGARENMPPFDFLNVGEGRPR